MAEFLARDIARESFVFAQDAWQRRLALFAPDRMAVVARGVGMTSVPILFQWQGGKSRLADWIVPRLPPHRAYVEPFAGTAAILLAKPPSPIEVLNDLNEDIVTVYRCVQDPRLWRRLYRRLRWTPISRVEWEQAIEPTDDPVERAARFLIRHVQGFGGKPGGGAWGGG